MLFITSMGSRILNITAHSYIIPAQNNVCIWKFSLHCINLCTIFIHYED